MEEQLSQDEGDIYTARQLPQVNNQSAIPRGVVHSQHDRDGEGRRRGWVDQFVALGIHCLHTIHGKGEVHQLHHILIRGRSGGVDEDYTRKCGGRSGGRDLGREKQEKDRGIVLYY